MGTANSNKGGVPSCLTQVEIGFAVLPMAKGKVARVQMTWRRVPHHQPEKGSRYCYEAPAPPPRRVRRNSASPGASVNGLRGQTVLHAHKRTRQLRNSASPV